MYQSYEFTYAGKAASMFGMFVCDIGSKKHGDNPFGNKANIVETRIANRVTPIHHGVRYNDEPLTFTLIFGAERRMDRFEMQEIANWLTGYQQYQWLTIDQPDLNHVQFRCLIQSLTPISVRWLPVAFEAKIVCDCPYAYGYPFERVYAINGETAVRFYNDGTCREPLKPGMTVTLDAGCTSFSARNDTTGETMAFADLPSGGIVAEIDNENQVVRETKYGVNLYDKFNFRFLELAQGDNRLVFDGIGTVKLAGRFLYNVGA